MKKVILLLTMLISSFYLFAADRYWVGATAGWDGIANLEWSSTSGGVGGASEPTAADNVFFDANSGSGSIYVTTTTALCLNLDFTGFAGTITGGSPAELWIYGNLTLSSTMLFNYNWNIRFKATSGLFSIKSNGMSFSSSVYFDGAGGNWQLLDDLELNNAAQTLELTQGTLNANNKNITCGRFKSSNSNNRTLVMGSGTWTLNGDGTVWDLLNPSFLVLNSNTSTIKITENGLNSKEINLGSGHYYNLWITGNGSGTYLLNGNGNVVFNDFKDDNTSAHVDLFSNANQYTVTTFNVSGTPGNFISLKSNSMVSNFTLNKIGGVVNCDYLEIYNSDAVTLNGATWYAGGHSINLGGNSGWIFSSLPLKLLEFTANFKEQKKVLLSWSTSNEINTSHFGIQRSYDGKEFVTIGNVYGNISNENIKNYAYEDTKFLTNKAVIYYRLQMLDKDGSVTYSTIKSLNFINKTQLISIYPNPAKGNIFTIDLGIEVTNPIGYTIASIEGKVFIQGSIISRQQTINLSNLDKGIYFIKLDNGQQEKFIKD